MNDMDSKIHAEEGPISLDNQRFTNQLILGLLYPDIVPEVIVPTDDDLKVIDATDTFPVAKKDFNGDHILEKIEGITELDIINFTILAYSQIKNIFNSSGILLIDRQFRNMMLTEESVNVDPSSVLSVGQKKYHISQSDLWEVFDIETEKRMLDPNINYKNRMTTESLKEAQTKIEVQKRIHFELRTLFIQLRNLLLSFWQKIGPNDLELENELKYFIDKYDLLSGERSLITFEIAEKFFEKMLLISTRNSKKRN